MDYLSGELIKVARRLVYISAADQLELLVDQQNLKPDLCFSTSTVMFLCGRLRGLKGVGAKADYIWYGSTS